MIDKFDGKYAFLSNFWSTRIIFDNESYRTVEHAFQAAKTFNPEEREKIKNANTPGKAKRLGRKVQLRPDWEDIKYTMMQSFVKQKFEDPKLKNNLLTTGDEELVEGNTWGDKIWGVCDGQGQNLLGKILMQVREEAKNG